jgi:hypothetical protein
MIPVVIPTMPERAQALAETLEQLQSHRWALAIVSPHTDSRKDVGNALRAAAAARPAAPWLIYLEDDVRLSPRFSEVPAILAGVSDPAIGAVCFFRSKDDLPDGLTRLSATKMSMSQCTAIRSLLPDYFDRFAEAWYSKHPQHRHASDLLIGAWVSFKLQQMLVHSPSLVQHRPLKSTLGPRARNRQSASFRRAFGEIA